MFTNNTTTYLSKSVPQSVEESKIIFRKNYCTGYKGLQKVLILFYILKKILDWAPCAKMTKKPIFICNFESL
jgi:hypothetical protein